jgi:putative ABC transport system permease protein
MFKQYVRSAIRTIVKHKGFTFLNVFGLALGLSICLLIVFYVFDELSYDRYNTKADRIVRVNSDLKFGGAAVHFAITAPAVGIALKREFPEVENQTRITPVSALRFKKGSEEIQEDSAAYCDTSIFDVFSLPMVRGNATTALTEPNAIVLSESAARKYFNTTDVIGQTLFSINDSMIHKVTGVIQDIPGQSHFHFDFLLPISALAAKDDDNWVALNYNTYLLLRPGVDSKKFEAKLPPFIAKALTNIHFDVKAFENGGNHYRLSLMKLTDIHLRSNRVRELSANSNIQYVYIFAAVAIFILLMACVNFINLSTARSSDRAREVGVRKVLGSSRKYLVCQFLAESLILTLIAVGIALFTDWLLLPVFNRISSKELTISLHSLSWLMPCVIGSVLVVGIVAGAYPAFYLSGFKPVEVLKGKIARGFKGSGLRGSLVVLQFSLSIFLIISTLVVFDQMHYIENKDLGFDRNHVLLVKNVDHLSNPDLLRQAVTQVTGVVDATQSDFMPTGKLRAQRTVTINTPDKISIFTEFWPVDEHYLNTMDMHLVRGRNFSAQYLTDSSGMIVNETAARMLGISNRSLTPGTDVYNDDHDNKKYHILGIVKDFNFNSLRDNVTPVVLTLGNEGVNCMAVRIKSGNLAGLLDQVRTKWNALAPHEQFKYSFMDDDFEAIYLQERRMAQLFTTFSILAVCIACLGLFGLAAYAGEQRAKEMSIRKVLGADSLALLALLSKEFMKLVAISILIAIPAGWWVMHNWLQEFSYRENIQWWVLLYPALGAAAIAVLAISSQSIKTALVNPAEALRSE